MVVTGRGSSGSWQIRGIQLGDAIGAKVQINAVSPGELTILVKRSIGLRRVVWDVVDAWPQPFGNEWDKVKCLRWMDAQIATIRPIGIVAATQQMANDCAWYKVPVLALPHHCRPGIERNPVRKEVKKVGYEGGEHYLGKWLPLLQKECLARGWQFVMSPDRLADLDIVVALRDADGYAPANWKSNVKLANAQGSGTPVICSPEAGYRETASGAERWVESPEDLTHAFDSLTSYDHRADAAGKLYDSRITLEQVAEVYRSWLRSNFS